MNKVTVKAGHPDRVGLYAKGPEFDEYPGNEVVITGHESFVVPATAQVMDAIRRGNLILVEEEGEGVDATDSPPSDEEEWADFTQVKGIGEKMANALNDEGYHTWMDVADASDDDLMNVPGMTAAKINALKDHARDQVKVDPARGENGDPQ